MSQYNAYHLPEHKQTLLNKYFANMDAERQEAVGRLLFVSDYACQHIKDLYALLCEDQCIQALSRKDYCNLAANIPDTLEQPAFNRALRQFRHRHLLRILFREQSGLSNTESSMQAWSDCADAIILHTLDYCLNSLVPRYGMPHSTSGHRVKLEVIALGKLGGRELNYSSDIDLIFFYTAEGYSTGKKSIDNQQYFSKVIQQFVAIMQTMTAEGFVFRVDLRLRPNGESGPLVVSLTAIETYYQEQGRDWERYAMVKARLIHKEFAGYDDMIESVIRPFVYRRYVDFSVIESLRSMKAMIAREVRLKSLSLDIKKGAGGIREIEFIIQSFQLIRGGRIPLLRRTSALLTLDVLQKEALLDNACDLKDAYLFLRKLENYLQANLDQQVHTLPDNPDVRLQLAVALGYPDFKALQTKLLQVQRFVGSTFLAVLSQADIYTDETRLLANQFSGIWHGQVEESLAVNVLSSLGYDEASRCYQLLQEFRHAPRCRRLTQAARLRLDRFMVLLLQELAAFPQTDVLMLKAIRLLEKTVARSAYLALLTENPNVLKELLRYFTVSPFISELVVAYPFLLEVLLDEKKNWYPPSYECLQQSLKSQPEYGRDTETHYELLRQFKLRCFLLVARAEVNGMIEAMAAGRFLADVAQLIINEVLQRACLQLSLRFPEMATIQPHVAVIAYGKLGSREMNYDSDVDLVFLHSANVDKEFLITRLVQKTIHILTMRTQGGTLYAVDTRLRPSGEAGLLVSTMQAYLDYQRQSAWVWEHQALLRARIIFGHQDFAAPFAALKKNIVCIARDRAELASTVQNMRAKMKDHTMPGQAKKGAEALLDLEFLVQFLVLANSDERFSAITNSLEQINMLYHLKVLKQQQWLVLTKAYQEYHQLLHDEILRFKSHSVPTLVKEVAAISRFFYTM